MECTIKTHRLELYKCEICGNIVEVMSPGMQALVCCKQPMKLMVENTVDAAREKHVPVIEKTDGGYKVKVGEAAHPMEEKHYIQWIQLIAGDTVLTQYLRPGQLPEAVFLTKATSVTAREYCNLHGQWSKTF